MNLTYEQMGLFSGSVDFLPGALPLAKAHQCAGQQQDNMCGPYWVSLLLATHAGVELDPTQVGHLAGSMLPIGEPPEAIAAALNRDGSTSQGGILLFIAAADQSEAETIFSKEGFTLASWDNGTPYSA
jgi:hypothetical protein